MRSGKREMKMRIEEPCSQLRRTPSLESGSRLQNIANDEGRKETMLRLRGLEVVLWGGEEIAETG